jgi:hypothetical protein
MQCITELDAHRQGVELDTLRFRPFACASPQCHILLSSPKRSCVAAAATTFPFSS